MTASDVLQRYTDEWLPEFAGMTLVDVNQRGIFENYPLHIACVRGDMDEVIALIAGGADVNAVGEHDYRPIHDAIAHGHPRVVSTLLKHAADLNGVSSFGDTPVALARREGNPEIIALIESAIQSRQT